MKRNKFLALVLVILLIFSLSLTACGKKENVVEDKTVRLAIATGGTSGTYFPLGGAFANIINEKVDGATANAESTGASLENVNLLNNGDVDFALIQNDISYYAFTGTEMFADKSALPNLRAVASLYPEIVQIVAAGSAEINSVEDLRGKRVAVGAPGSGVETNARQILAAYGMTYEDIQADYLSFAEAADGIKDGHVHAAFITAGTPTAAITDLSTTHDINLVAIPSEMAATLGESYPFYEEVVIPAGTYRNQEEDINTVAVMAMLTVRAGLDEELVYNITKALFENLDAMAAAHSRGADISLDTAKYGLSLDLHPGAARYFDEVGK